MFGLNPLETLFTAAAFTFQIVLTIHFALRKWRFDTAIRYGPIVYALGLPAAIVSTILLWNGTAWSFWIAGYLYLVWGLFGYTVEYILKVEWRSPVRWPVLIPYLLLYFATSMFYWFPLALIRKPLLYIFAVLYLASSILNVTSHKTNSPNPRASA